MEPIRVYLDLPLWGGLLSWIQDATLLWMVAQVSSVKVPLRRCLLGGVAGGCFHFLLLINQVSQGAIFAWILSPLISLFLVPLLMLGLTFYSGNLRVLLRVGGYFYLLAFLLAGIHWGLDSISQRFLGWEITWWWRFWIHLALIFILGELGWGIVHRRLWDKICLYPVEISWEGQVLRLNALLDTGNRLHDALTNVPVVIVELSQISRFLPPELLKLVDSLQGGELDLKWDLPVAWEGRVRLLPFNSLGKEHGMLIGFRPDQFKVWQEEKVSVNQHVVVGLYNRKLSPEGAFQALIPPAVLEL